MEADQAAGAAKHGCTRLAGFGRTNALDLLLTKVSGMGLTLVYSQAPGWVPAG